MHSTSRTTREEQSNCMPTYTCGGNRYNIEELSHCYELLTHLHTLAHRIIEKHYRTEKIQLYIYGAATPGRLTAMVLEEYPQISVKGFFDQNTKLSFVNYDLNILSSSRLPILHPSTMAKQKIDAIVCSTAPAFYPEIIQMLQINIPQTPCYFIHHTKNIPSIHQEESPKVPLLVSTTSRCGTHWLGGILKFLFSPYNIKEIKAYTNLENNQRLIKHNIFKKLKQNQYAIDHFELTSQLINYISPKKVKSIFLYRDPRDMQVSASFYNQKSFSFDLDYITTKIDQIMKWQNVPQVHLIRYENLKEHPEQTLQKIANFLELNIDHDTNKKILRANSFKYLSGGRNPGQTDPCHHYRKGIIGDWKNHYTRDNINQIKTLCGENLIKIGYEQDLSW